LVPILSYRAKASLRIEEISDIGGCAEAPPLLTGSGEMGALIRAYRWADSSLGSPIEWPIELKTLVFAASHLSAADVHCMGRTPHLAL
jgi:hypothetical protein